MDAQEKVESILYQLTTTYGKEQYLALCREFDERLHDLLHAEILWRGEQLEACGECNPGEEALMEDQVKPIETLGELNAVLEDFGNPDTKVIVKNDDDPEGSPITLIRGISTTYETLEGSDSKELVIVIWQS